MAEAEKRELLVTAQDYCFGPGEENALELDCGRKLYNVRRNISELLRFALLPAENKPPPPQNGEQLLFDFG